MTTIWDNYWRNAIIVICVIVVYIVLIHFIFGYQYDVPIIFLTWGISGLLAGAIILSKKWYDGYPITIGHIGLMIILSIGGFVFLHLLCQFKIDPYIKYIFSPGDKTYKIINGRKNARVLRILSQ